MRTGAARNDSSRSLLTKVSVEIQKRDSRSSMAHSEYNIFHVLEVEEKEVVMCRFLADLLNPEGTHGCGILFLKSFLLDVLGKKEITDTLLFHTNVRKEFTIEDERRIDIVIENIRFFIPIEVKIYAGEQKGQCYDYYQYAKNAQMVYLTRFGHMPSAYSRKNRHGSEILPTQKINCISWKEDICGWLESLIPVLDQPIKSIVMQYIDTIHMFTDQREEMLMKRTVEILCESEDYFRSGLQIEKSAKAAKLRLIRQVFDDFREEMNEITAHYGLEPEIRAHYYSYENAYHQKFYDCYSTYPGLNYIVKGAEFQKSSLQMWFRIEIEHRLFAGLCLFDTEAEPQENQKGYQVNDITPGLVEEAARYINKDMINPEDWWFSWCYSNGKRQADDTVPDFKEMNYAAIALSDHRKRKEFVKCAVKNFEESLLQYLLRTEK